MCRNLQVLRRGLAENVCLEVCLPHVAQCTLTVGSAVVRHMFASPSGHPEVGDFLCSVQEALFEGIMYTVYHATYSLKAPLHIINMQKKR